VLAACLVNCPRASAQTAASVEVPNVIAAGETLKFTITLDVAPNFNGGVVQYLVSGPDGNIATAVPVEKGSRICSGEFTIPEAATGGTWHFRITGFFTGTRSAPLKFTEVPFQVIAVEHLTIPSAATVQINPSQVQLFRTEAKKLQLRVQNFKVALTASSETSNQALFATVNDNVDGAVKALDETQKAFRGLATTADQKQIGEIFFVDLRQSYVDLSVRLRKSSFHPVNYQQESQPLPMPNKHGSLDGRYNLASQAALRPFEQNELAYRIVADTQSLTFDLTVKSNPVGAAICYHRRGDPCRANPESTNTTIKTLPYAIWLVQFQKAGYNSKEVEHDPFRDPDHVIDVQLDR
jgi:hypothetical protein